VFLFVCSTSKDWPFLPDILFMPCWFFCYHVDWIFHNIEWWSSEADRLVQPHQKQPRYSCISAVTVCLAQSAMIKTTTIIITRASSTSSAAAAEQAAYRKSLKYADLPASFQFQPIAVETLGSINDSATDFLDSLRQMISARKNEVRERMYLYQRISITIQRFSAVLLHDTFSCSNDPNLWPLFQT